MSEGESRPAGALDLHNESRRAHPMTGPVENFGAESAHGQQQPQRPDQLRGAESLATRAALNQESEFGPRSGPTLRSRTEISETLSSRPADGEHLREVGAVDTDLGRPPRAEPPRQTLDGGRGHAAVTGAVDFEDRGQRAHREAIGFLQRELPVSRRIPGCDVEALLEGAKVIRGSGQTATQPRTDPDQVALRRVHRSGQK